MLDLLLLKVGHGKMVVCRLVGFLALFCACVAQYPQSSCRDLDAQACLLFSMAKPDLCNDAAFSQTTCRRFCGNCPLECYACPTPVLNPLDCNTTTTCSINQTCVTKHLAAAGHHEYILACELKAICLGLSFGFGKRDGSESERDRYGRDVTIACCDTDFCNSPNYLTTKTTTTTRLPPTSSGPFPHGCDRDIVFVLDDSGSVGRANFLQGLGFIKEIVQQLTIGPANAMTGLVAYSTHAYPMWHLNEILTKQQLLLNLSSVPYQGGITRTNEALKLARTTMLTSQHGDRPNNKNVVIVFTDGDSNDKQDTISEANNLRTVSDDVISIVIGSGINIAELNALATDSHHVFDVHSYNSLQSILPQLMQIICNA
ncbi:hypothetical protein DPMN_193850 [Dreissena polymorpha]|uniref:VWFA domain-containing protein n=2 Tax=Dreissena polymorpha TaxID=45954 RepID=A0A9D3Y5L5_DREPO|nr:hypothetical protein DPMN_193850 [Dreissena polymorpha]